MAYKNHSRFKKMYFPAYITQLVQVEGYYYLAATTEPVKYPDAIKKNYAQVFGGRQSY